MHTIALTAAVVALGCSGTDTNRDLTAGSSGSSGSSGASGSGTAKGSGTDTSAGPSSSIGTPENEALFHAPSGTATPDSIFGLWGGVLKDGNFSFDTRTKLTPSTMTFATRCEVHGQTSSVVGVTVAARVSDQEIDVLESKKEEKLTGDVTCRANAAPGIAKRCEQVDGFQTQCFTLDGMQLTLYGATSFDTYDLTKLSD